MLSSYVVKRFLNRDLDSFNWMKKLSKRTLLRMVDELDPKPDFVSPRPLWKHQLVAFLIGVYCPQFLYLLDMGLGKTRVMLEIIAYRKKCGQNAPTLVVVPNDPGVETWVTEVEGHRRDLVCVPMYGSSKERWRLFEEEADVFVISYPGLNWMVSGLEKVPKRKSRKMTVKPHLINKMAKKFGTIVLDESTNIMTKSSVTYRVCNRLGKRILCRFALTGTPIGRDPQAFWSQFYFIDHGETLGDTLALFRQAYFKRHDHYWSGGYKYTFDKKKKKRLNRALQNRSIFYEEGECNDMPKKVYKPLYVSLTDEMKDYYANVLDTLKKSKGDFTVQKNSFLRMRQIASGFIGIVDEETGEKSNIEFPTNPKMEAMMASIQELPEKRKFLIFHEFNWSGNRIHEELDKLGIKHGRLYGGTRKDGPKIVRAFRNDDSIRGLVINTKSGAYALNLQVANYEYIYESPVSVIQRKQMEKRIHRGEQKRRCFYMDFIMRGNSADELVQRCRKEGEDLYSVLLRNKRALLDV